MLEGSLPISYMARYPDFLNIHRALSSVERLQDLLLVVRRLHLVSQTSKFFNTDTPLDR